MARTRSAHRRTLVTVGAVVLTGCALATLTLLLTSPESPVLLWFAAAYVWSVAGLVLGDVLAARRALRDEEARLRADAGVSSHVLADRAVHEERRRLAVDIRGVLVDTLTQVRDGAERALTRPAGDAGAGDAGAGDALVASLRTRTQVATSELRRLLGILRVADGTDGPVHDPVNEQEEVPPAAGPARATDQAWRPPRRDVVETAVIVALGAAEAVINTSARDGAVAVGVVVATVLAAGAFVGRTVAPVVTAVVQSLVFAVASWLGAPVMSGVWLVRGVGAVLWRTASGAPGRAELGAALLLATTVLASRQQEPALGVGATAAVVVMALTGGLLRSRTARRSAAATEAATLLRRRTAHEVALAVTAERVRMARELHDVVSHSVGLISMQLNVLEVATTPEARVRALRDVVATSDEALRELTPLDRFEEMPAVGPRTVEDVLALVDRVRATGGCVGLTLVGEPPATQMGVVYRVLQEALTNTMQHAPGADVAVRVRTTADGTWLSVHDDGPGPAGQPVRRYGMVGLRERVALAGGTLEAGGDATRGGFRVDAFLPAPTRAARTTEVLG
ncbi:sensor histidine kinase [Ornithinimicrobium kibberense]|uniref:histidine kinase n=2 Tax=Ornithinimicrobium kibberense TaxID=282060 RepID=A0ABV5V4Z4_9MICO|nr:histidine kinase [Ornithinimicrobium kibberense]